MTSSATPADQHESHPDGGDWIYGDSVSGGVKDCYSSYYHPTLRHSSTAKMNAQTSKDTEAAGIYTYADVELNNTLAGECYAYWDTL